MEFDEASALKAANKERDNLIYKGADERDAVSAKAGFMIGAKWAVDMLSLVIAEKDGELSEAQGYIEWQDKKIEQLKKAVDLALYYIEGDATYEGVKLKIDALIKDALIKGESHDPR